jgi:hypothetical protein
MSCTIFHVNIALARFVKSALIERPFDTRTTLSFWKTFQSVFAINVAVAITMLLF